MKILIVKTSSLGDLIHVFPSIEYLKAKFPEAQIDWVVEKQFAEVLQAHPLVDNVITINTKIWRRACWKLGTWAEINEFRRTLQQVSYDVVFDLQGNIKSGLITALAISGQKVGFSRKCVPEWPNLLFTNRKFAYPNGQNIRADYLSIVQQFFNDKVPYAAKGVPLTIAEGDKQKIASLLSAGELVAPYKILVCPGSVWPNKQLSEETLMKLLQKIQKDKECSFLFTWGNIEEKALAQQLQSAFPLNSVVIDRYPLPILQYLMSKVDLVVAMDSLPLHLAGTSNTPTFSVFGSSSSAKYRPEGGLHVSYQGICPYGRIFEKRCPELRSCPTGKCMKAVCADKVYDAFSKRKQDA